MISDKISSTPLGAQPIIELNEKERVLTESEQKEIRDIFTDMGYDGSAIEFDSYEEQYPTLMRTYKRV